MGIAISLLPFIHRGLRAHHLHSKRMIYSDVPAFQAGPDAAAKTFFTPTALSLTLPVLNFLIFDGQPKARHPTRAYVGLE